MMENFCQNYLDALAIPPGENARDLDGKHQAELERKVCQYISTTGPMVKFFLSDNNYHLFCQKFSEQFRKYCQNHQIIQIYPDGHMEPLKHGIFYDYYIHMTCLQLFAVLECWAQRNFSETEEDFIEIFNTLHSSTFTLQGQAKSTSSTRH
ncbi:MAG: hypothetical protein Q4B70_12245 [Lachnospiraceae bacterium]|nr:hypothetical protein [Lachnospiraceae bacterium]